MTLIVDSCSLAPAVSESQLEATRAFSEKKSIILSEEAHPWPACFSAAVSKLLDEARIPNFLWGDLLNEWRGNPLVSNTCGFVVPKELLIKATAVIGAAGLPVCSCHSHVHRADSDSAISVPVHFPVPQPYGSVILFLCPSDILLDLIPLTPDHVNPASLTYERLNVSLHDRFHPFVADEATSPSLDGGSNDSHVLNVLTTESLVKVLLLLDVLSPPDRMGVGYMYTFVLHTMVAYGVPPGPYDFEFSSLQQFWDKRYIRGDLSIETWRAMREQVIKEWTGRPLTISSI